MNNMVKELRSLFKPLKRINRITLINYAAIILIIILVILFWRNREGLTEENAMSKNEQFINEIIETNRRIYQIKTSTSLLSENAIKYYSVWKGRTMEAISAYVNEYIKYHGKVNKPILHNDMDTALNEAISTFTSNLPIGRWPYSTALVGTAGYISYITATTYRDDIGGVASTPASTPPPETGTVTAAFSGRILSGSITRDSADNFTGCTFSIVTTDTSGNFPGYGGTCAFTLPSFTGGVVTKGTLTGGALIGGASPVYTILGGLAVVGASDSTVSGEFNDRPITGAGCTLKDGKLRGTLTGITITGVDLSGNTIKTGNIAATFSGTFTRSSSYNDFQFNVPETNTPERATFTANLKDIEEELMDLITDWRRTNPNTDFTVSKYINNANYGDDRYRYSPYISNTDDDDEWAYNNRYTPATRASTDSARSVSVGTGTTPAADYWRNKYYEQVLVSGSGIERNSSMPYDTMSNESSFWRKKYEDQINGIKSGSISPYNSSASYSTLQNSSNATASNTSNTSNISNTSNTSNASNTSNSGAVKSTNSDSCSASTDDMYMLKSKMVYMNPTDKNSTQSTNNYTDSRDNKQSPYPPCPPCDRCPEAAFDCKKVPNYKSVAINQYLPQPVLSSFSQFGM